MKDPRRRTPPAVTTASRSNRREPRLPHERDESSDPQAPINRDAQTVGRQAARDIARGLVDTDRGPVLEELNEQHFTAAKRRAAKRR